MVADVAGDLPTSFPWHRVGALGNQSPESNGMEQLRVRIQPPSLPISENDPFANDRLGRQESAEVLTRIVSRIEGPCVLALDAPWGYGKTTFLNMWEAWLRQEGQGFPVVACFNAWETDFTHHPFLALSSELTKVLESCPKTASSSAFNAFKQAGVKLLRAAIPVIPQLAGSLVPGGGVFVEAVLSALSAAASEKADTNAYLDAKAAIASFKEALEALAQGLEKPMVIMIDELDRCRPSYAVELLEVAKHLFAVDNVVFVLAVNRDELVHSVKALYGIGFDAEGYLCRFFDLDFQLPKPGREQFVQELLETSGLTSILDTRESPDERQTARTLLEAFLGSPELSLRDVQQAVHRLGLVLLLLPADAHLLAVTAVVAIVLRTVDLAVYRRFVAGEATDEEVVDKVFGLQGTAPLCSENDGWWIQSRIILGLLAAKAKEGVYHQGFSGLRSPLLDQWRELEKTGTPNSTDVMHVGLQLTRMQQQWIAMQSRDPNRQIQTFLDSIRRLELLSPELGENGSV